MLLTLLLEPLGFLSVFRQVRGFILVDGFFLLQSHLFVFLCLLLHLLSLLFSELLLGVLGFVVPLSNLHDLDSFLLGLFDLLPRLE